MSCGSNFETSNCVCDTLLAIAEAQDRVSPNDDCPAKGCQRAIDELKHGQKFKEHQHNTVPVMLTLYTTGLPFIGFGAVREESKHGASSLIYSSIFRVDNVDPDTCCATLELLRKKHSWPYVTDVETPSVGASLFDLHNEELEGTGAYITVDLDLFGAVTCLFPVTIHHDCE